MLNDFIYAKATYKQLSIVLNNNNNNNTQRRQLSL
jgi:hypothetical protein